jgi:hypothetical protein
MRPTSRPSPAPELVGQELVSCPVSAICPHLRSPLAAPSCGSPVLGATPLRWVGQELASCPSRAVPINANLRLSAPGGCRAAGRLNRHIGTPHLPPSSPPMRGGAATLRTPLTLRGWVPRAGRFPSAPMGRHSPAGSVSGSLGGHHSPRAAAPNSPRAGPAVARRARACLLPSGRHLRQSAVAPPRGSPVPGATPLSPFNVNR